MEERIKGRKNFPTDDVDPKNFISDERIKEMVENLENVKFNQDNFLGPYNCVHCGECETELERIRLKQKFIEDGNTFEGLDEIIDNFKKYRSPYPTNKMRIKKPEGIPKTSDTLFFMGCLSTIRIPKYTEHALQYLLKQNIDFTILEAEICCGWHLLAGGLRQEFDICIEENVEIFKNFEKIICLCPACYYLFNTFYKPKMKRAIYIQYITDLLKPSETKKEGRIGIQHLCQLINREREDVEKTVDNVLTKSGYEIVDIPHWCCGGGTGWMGRTDVIDAIARKRMEDFDREDIDFATTYCVSCWWILRRYGKKCKIKLRPKDIFELLI